MIQDTCTQVKYGCVLMSLSWSSFTSVIVFFSHKGAENYHLWSSLSVSDVDAVSLKVLGAPLVLTIEGHIGAESCWLKAESV